MPKFNLNPKILKVINEKAGSDNDSRKFLNEVLFEELENQSTWWFGPYYKKKIREYSERWSKQYENKSPEV
jgi:hypothetical protein